MDTTEPATSYNISNLRKSSGLMFVTTVSLIVTVVGVVVLSMMGQPTTDRLAVAMIGVIFVVLHRTLK